MRNPRFRRTWDRVPLWLCWGVSAKKRKFGEWSSRMVTMSEREGLLGPAFCAFIVRNVRVVNVKRAAGVDAAAPVVSVSPAVEGEVSLCI